MRRKLFLLTLFLLGTLLLQAQQRDYDAAKDLDSVVIEAPATAHEADEELEEDTILDYIPVRRISDDSVTAWKKQKGFGYTRYLDSLLRLQEKDRQDMRLRQSRMNRGKKNGSGDEEEEVVVQQDRSWMGTLFQSPALRVILWILAGGFILFILYRLFFAEGLFMRKTTSVKGTAEDTSGEDLLAETGDFASLARQAAVNGNYRLAVRYHYLQVLHSLADKKLLELSVDKTNYQYVREISNTPYRDEFAQLTLHYEYVWYGEFNIEAPVYNRIATAFTNFNQKI